jgi:transposase-like protein
MRESVYRIMSAPKTLLDAVKHFADFDNCKDFMVARRWPNGVTCPVCGSESVYWDSSRKGWECKTRHEKRKFTLKTGTIFEDSPIGLDKWLPVVWMIANAKNGVSSWEIHRAIGVTQKTAWFMLQRIRLAMQDPNGGGGKLGGEVEIDETFIGGKARHVNQRTRTQPMKGRASGITGKTVVMGLLERHGEGRSRVRTFVVSSPRKNALVPHVYENVEPGAQVYTDALKSYNALDSDYTRSVIDHAESYVDGNVHTNGIENYWALLKRMIKGTYVSIEPFHLFRYLDEQAFRFNERATNDAERFSMAISQIVGKRLTYAQLIGAERP